MFNLWFKWITFFFDNLFENIYLYRRSILFVINEKKNDLSSG